MIVMTRCQVPNCDHAGYTITNLHYTEKHGISKKEANEIYGKPIQRTKIVKHDAKADLTFNRSIHYSQDRITRSVKKYYC